jgi:hypothetical protein
VTGAEGLFRQRVVSKACQVIISAEPAKFDHDSLPFRKCEGPSCNVCRIDKLRLALSVLAKPLGPAKIDAWRRAMRAQDLDLPPSEVYYASENFDWERPLHFAARQFVTGRGGGCLPRHSHPESEERRQECLMCAIESLRLELIGQDEERGREIWDRYHSEDAILQRQQSAEANDFFR